MRMQKFNVSAAAVRIIRGLRLSLSRPLFVVLAGITAAIWAAELVFPCRLVDYEAIRGEEIELTGTVSTLEQKREGEDLVWKMVLKDVVIRNILALKDPGRSGFFENVSVSENPKENGSAGLYFDNVEDTIPGVVCILDEEPPVDISSRVLVRGTVYPFRGAMNEGEFDIRMYYHILNIEFSVRDVELLAVSRKEDHVSAALYHLKRRLSESIDTCFSEQNAPVMKAMLLGEKGMLDQETRELYKGAGIIHVLSISGKGSKIAGVCQIAKNRVNTGFFGDFPTSNTGQFCQFSNIFYSKIPNTPFAQMFIFLTDVPWGKTKLPVNLWAKLLLKVFLGRNIIKMVYCLFQRGLGGRLWSF